MSKKDPSVKLNMFMNALLTLSSIIFPVITMPYVTRVLGAEGVGRVYFASSVIAAFAMFAELGVPVYGIRACARVRDDRDELSRTVREIMLLNLGACIGVYVCFGILLHLVPKFSQERTLLLIMSSTMLLNCLGAEWLYKSLEKYTYITVRSVSFKLIALIAMFVLVRNEQDYIVYGAITIFAAAGSDILNMLSLHRYVDLRPSGQSSGSNPSDLNTGRIMRKHLAGMLMFFALAAATTVYTNLDLAILGFIKGDAEAGLYGVSVRIKLVIVSLVTSVSAVLLPRNSFYYEKDRKSDFYRLIAATLRMVMIVAAPAALYFMTFARESILVLAGNGFIGAVRPMIIIMPSVIFIGISNIIGMQMLVPAGRERDVVTAAVIGAVSDLILNILLIPKFASAGAAAATLVAEILVTGYMIYCIRDHAAELFRWIPAKSIVTALVIAGLAGTLTGNLAGSIFGSFAGSPFAKLCISSVFFFGLYALIIYLFERRPLNEYRNLGK